MADLKELLKKKSNYNYYTLLNLKDEIEAYFYNVDKEKISDLRVLEFRNIIFLEEILIRLRNNKTTFIQGSWQFLYPEELTRVKTILSNFYNEKYSRIERDLAEWNKHINKY